ncbi:MAG: MerR family transcriptional regulator [Defluviitaleaceae bacterium]|nr:MerR family transcriptional regulator [Defluviitaleaceae bacterium]
MELIRINEVVESFGVSSRTLRYYEEKGLLWSQHPENKAQRYYDESALERLKQIIVLRKLQIPIKDIVTIFESESMSALIQVFVDKLDTLDVEITALSELRRLVDDFLHKMLISGIKKISAITLLYEETEKRIATTGESEPISLERVSEVSRNVLKLHDVRIIRLPSMRVLSSRLKTGEVEALDLDKMQNLFTSYGFSPNPSFHNCFFKKEINDEWVMMIKIPIDYENRTQYIDEHFQGGLYAVSSSFMEDMDDTFVLLRDWVNKSDDFELETGIEMIEEILPWDIAIKFNRYQQDVYIPIKMR